MIFVTVGGTSHSFNRLIKQMDEIAANIDNDVVIQKGWSSYEPVNAKSFDFVDFDEAINYFKNADVIVGHTSAGPLLYARKYNKPLILVPRRSDLNEHVDNHQMETANAIKNSSEMVEIVFDVKDLENAIERAVLKTKQNLHYESPISLDGLTTCISDFVNTVNQNKKRITSLEK